MVIFDKTWIGKTVGVNKRKDARAIKKGGRWIATMYTGKEYKEFKDSMVNEFLSLDEPFIGPVDMAVSCCLWKRKDSDSFVKAVMDALEESNVLKNDNQIRNIHIFRSYHPMKEVDRLRVRLSSVDN